MKRFALVVVLAVLLVALGAGSAFASGWHSPPIGGAVPHGGYATTTAKCKQCHAVHEAENAANSLNGERLLRTTVEDACIYCHVGGPITATQVYDSDPANWVPNTAFNHQLGAGIVVPDSADPVGQANPANDYTIVDFTCSTCHSVHGAFTLGYAILKNNPRGDADTITAGDPLEPSMFCADCHDNNLVEAFDAVSGPDQVSHVMTTAVSVSAADSNQCSTCHGGGDGSPANSYPHLTAGAQFLKDAYDGNNGANDELDSVCLDCHNAIGSDY